MLCSLMNLRPLLSLPVVSLIVSCDTLNEPIYYDSAGQPIPQVSTAQTPVAPIQQPSVIAPAQTIPTYQPSANPTRNSTPSSPFMQPDVLGMPSKDDLKETATSTRTGGSSSGLTVPTR
jgi:hypothetical protein